MLTALAPDEPRPFGAYVLLKALGRGAMGDVHLARPYNPNRGIPTPVVVKRLHGELAKKKGFVARFTHEAEVAVNVESKHVAKVYDAGSVGDTLYITMEYVTGWPLSKVLDAILKSGRHASIASVVDSIAGALEGLQALHTATDASGNPLGVVHRDISPKNLMIGEDGLIHIIDLGLGKSNLQDWKTRTGVVMGSVGYMPPEQVSGDHVDARADVYAMGVVAFEMLALRNYVKRGPLPQMMAASQNPKFSKPSEFRPDVPSGLDDVIERALKPAKEARYQSAGEFLKGLRTIVPASHTTGGMRALIDELFGDTKIEREREIEALLSLPLPVEDPQDNEPTRVFVQRAGVRPDRRESVRVEAITGPGQEDSKGDRTFVESHDAPKTVATEVWGKEGSGNHAARPLPSVRDPAGSEPISMLPAPMLTQQLLTRGPGISLGVLIACVCLTAVISAVVAVIVAQRVMVAQPTIIQPAQQETEKDRPVVVQAQQSLEPVEQEPEPVEEEERIAPQKQKKALQKKALPVPETNGTAAVEVPPPTIDDEARSLIARADDLIRTLTSVEDKGRAIQIKLDLKIDLGSADTPRRRENLRKLRAELERLRSSDRTP
jgi:serine/threonine-protein kinase